jgi:hypothetical protein
MHESMYIKHQSNYTDRRKTGIVVAENPFLLFFLGGGEVQSEGTFDVTRSLFLRFSKILPVDEIVYI